MLLQNLSKAHQVTLENCKGVNKAILYGVSLDPLDAELSQILNSGWNTNSIKEVIIINPDHSIIASRVKLILEADRKIKLYGYHPKRLDVRYDYT